MGHWYSSEGEPTYTVIGANGKERPTTLRDARKEGYVPSVTTIFKVKASPGLDRYKQTQLLEAAWQHKRLTTGWAEYCREVVKKSNEHRIKAAETGSALHDELETYYKGGDISHGAAILVDPVVSFMLEQFPDVDDWIAEPSFTEQQFGFGGKVDMYSPGHNIILDWKTKSKADVVGIKAYDDHHMQTAAYAVGLAGLAKARDTKRYNLFISTQTPGNLQLTESTGFYREWGMFINLLNYWKLANNYKCGKGVFE